MLTQMWPAIRRDLAGSSTTARKTFAEGVDGIKEFMEWLPSQSSIWRQGTKVSVSRWWTWSKTMAERDSFHHLWALIFTKLAEDRQLINTYEDVTVQGARSSTDGHQDPATEKLGVGRKSSKQRGGGAAASSSTAAAGTVTTEPAEMDATRAKKSVQSLRDEMRKLRAKTKHTIHFAAALLMDTELTAMSRMVAAATNEEHLTYWAMTKLCRDPEHTFSMHCEWANRGYML
eukprot:5025833-Amphidinium_carterae.1